MQTYIVQGTEDTPTITLDPTTSQYCISGRSLPEDVVTFYKPSLDWLDEYFKTTHSEFYLDIKLEYFNTASSKILLDVFMKLDEVRESKDTNITIRWYYLEDDDDMLEAGEEYAELVGIKFEMIAV